MLNYHEAKESESEQVSLCKGEHESGLALDILDNRFVVEALTVGNSG